MNPIVLRAPVVALVLLVLLAGGTGPVEASGRDAAAPGTTAAPRDAPAGDYGWPLPGMPRVARGFSPPETTYGRGHRGVDLAAAPGTAVLAAGAGTVVFAGAVAGRGVVSVQHADGLRTTYEPVEAAVSVGAVVPRGATLGTLVAGHAGCPAAACLHWGVRRGTEYLDPLRLLGRWQVRLLPWE